MKKSTSRKPREKRIQQEAEFINSRDRAISPSTEVNTLEAPRTHVAASEGEIGGEVATLPLEQPSVAPTLPSDERREKVAALAEQVRQNAIAAKAATPKPAGKTPTQEQQAILDVAGETLRTKGTLVMQAGAGTGKTSTQRMLADVLNGTGQYTAFNTKLVDDSKSKFQGTRVSCNTTHSLAFRAVGSKYASRLNGQRVRSSVVASMLGIEDLTIQTGLDAGGHPLTKRLNAGYLASQVSGAIKRFCQSADSEVAASHFRYIDGIDAPTADGARGYNNNQRVREYLLPFAKKAWADLSNVEGQLPFSHDCYVKIWQLGNPVIACDYLLLDESQDTAEVMLDVIKQQKCAKFIVGDSAQQIYEWRGAVDALNRFPEATVRCLSQSFRFGPAIAAVANAVLETLDEPTQLRLKGLESIESTVEPIDTPACILCRTNAVAVSSLLEAIATNKRPYLVGGGSDVISFVEAAQTLQQGNSTSHPDLACFVSWVEVQEYVKSDEGEDLKLMVKLIDSFTCEVILSALKGMPHEKDADLIICTAHKSKGMEWDSVRLAADFPTKSKCSDSDRRLLYVAVTRAKLVLDVSSCPFFTGQDSLDISDLSIRYREQQEARGIVSPAPSTPVSPVEVSFTWAKGDEGWLVRGPKGQSGKSVSVVRKDGSKQTKLLGKAVKEFDNVSLYKV